MKQKIRTTEISIPYYETDDGQIFDNRNDAIEHEQKLYYGTKFIKNKQILTIDDEPATLYYLKNKEDFDYLNKTEWAFSPIAKHVYKDPGWYIAIKHDGGDHYDWYTVEDLTSYLNQYFNFIEKIKNLTSE